MKKTGDDELDFIREAGSEIMNYQGKAYVIALSLEVVALIILSGAVALLSTTVALWIVVIAGSLLAAQALFVAAFQFKARRFLKKHTSSTVALDKITDPFNM